MLAHVMGRRATLGVFYALMATCVTIAFGYSFYLLEHALFWFTVCLVFMGIGGASFCVFTVWLPEQYPTECRASAFAFATSFGRFIAAGATFAVGSAIAYKGTLGRPVAMTGLVFALALLILPFGYETRGRRLSD